MSPQPMLMHPGPEHLQSPLLRFQAMCRQDQKPIEAYRSIRCVRRLPLQEQSWLDRAVCLSRIGGHLPIGLRLHRP